MTEEHLLDGMLCRAAIVLGLALILADPVWRVARRSGPQGLGDMHDRPAVLGCIMLLSAVVAQTLLGVLEIAEVVRVDRIFDVLRSTAFGRGAVQVFVLACAVAVIRFMPFCGRRIGPMALTLSVGALAFALAIQGHAGEDGRASLQSVVHAIHLVGSASWLGGLLALVFAAARGEAACDAVVRFSRIAAATMAIVIPSGIVRLAAHVDGPRRLDTDYGRVLAFKIALVLGLLAIVVRHRRHSLPKMRRVRATSDRWHEIEGSFVRDVVLEVAMAFCVLFAATSLSQLAPPR